MLTYILALVVALGSFALYMAAFFFPEVHRKGDLIWSGVGMFYALVLWVCAGRITGGVLLGQIASVALLGWFGWQTLTLRRALTPAEQQTAVDGAELQEKASNLLNSEQLSSLSGQVTRQFTNMKDWFQAALANTNTPKENPTAVTSRPPYTPLKPEDFANAKGPDASKADLQADGATATTPVTPEPVEADPWSEPVLVEAETVAPPIPIEKSDGATPAKAASGSIVQQVLGIFKSFTQKPESKPIYVRKAYREAAEDKGEPSEAENFVDVGDSDAPVADDCAIQADAMLEAEIAYAAEQAAHETEAVVEVAEAPAPPEVTHETEAVAEVVEASAPPEVVDAAIVPPPESVELTATEAPGEPTLDSSPTEGTPSDPTVENPPHS